MERVRARELKAQRAGAAANRMVRPYLSDIEGEMALLVMERHPDESVSSIKLLKRDLIELVRVARKSGFLTWRDCLD